MASTDILAQLMEYVLAGNKNPQVLESLLLDYKAAVIFEIPPANPKE